jgi:hypothetical protein
VIGYGYESIEGTIELIYRTFSLKKTYPTAFQFISEYPDPLLHIFAVEQLENVQPSAIRK